MNSGLFNNPENAGWTCVNCDTSDVLKRILTGTLPLLQMLPDS